VAVLGNGAVERRALELPVELTDAQVERASAAAASFQVGATLDKTGDPGPTGDTAVDTLASTALQALRGPEPEVGTSHVFVGGAARMATAFEAVSTIRSVLGILEQQYVLVTLLKDVLDRGLTVAEVDGERAGTVGVLGPTRMHYDQALAAVAIVSKKLSKALSEGDQGLSPPSGRQRSTG
jgi:heat-inducible transcriptional repressor